MAEAVGQERVPPTILLLSQSDKHRCALKDPGNVKPSVGSCRRIRDLNAEQL